MRIQSINLIHDSTKQFSKLFIINPNLIKEYFLNSILQQLLILYFTSQLFQNFFIDHELNQFQFLVFN